MASREIIGGAAARHRRSQHWQTLSTQRGRVQGFSGSAERRGSKSAEAKAEFEYYRDTFFVPGF